MRDVVNGDHEAPRRLRGIATGGTSRPTTHYGSLQPTRQACELEPLTEFQLQCEFIELDLGHPQFSDRTQVEVSPYPFARQGDDALARTRGSELRLLNRDGPWK